MLRMRKINGHTSCGLAVQELNEWYCIVSKYVLRDHRSRLRMPALVTISLFLQLGLLCSAGPECWKRVEIPCNYSSWNQIASNLSQKTEVVFADCGAKTFHLASQHHNITTVNELRITGRKASVIDCSCQDCKNQSAGFYLANITNFQLGNLQLRNCFNSEFNGGVYITGCTNVTIRNVTIENSRGTGLVLEDNAGEILIENSTFQCNGHGYSDSDGNSSVSLNQTYSGVGGLKMLIGGGVENSRVVINNCHFLRNIGQNGGGLSIVLWPRAQGNTVMIQNGNFTDNKCHNGGGGGLQIGYTTGNRLDTEAVVNNDITVQGCTFCQNHAKYGGGTAIFSTLGSPEFSKNKLQFVDCKWTANTAELGMAVDVAIAPWETYSRDGLFPSPVFTNCEFTNHSQERNIPKGVFSVIGFKVELQGKTTFAENNATGIDATSAVLDFRANSSVTFIRNQAIHGGAMRLTGLSTIFVNDNSTFLFEENKALHSGGALYVQSYDKHSIISSNSCFLQYKGDGKPRNITVIFKNNSIGSNYENTNNSRYRGDSIYATTILPCLEKCIKSITEKVPVTETLKCIGNFEFDKIENKRHLSTGADHFSHINTGPCQDTKCALVAKEGQFLNNRNVCQHSSPLIEPLKLIPGKLETVKLKLVDELCGEVFFHVSVTVHDKDISLDPAYSIITDNRIIIYGNPQDSGVMQLSAAGLREVSLQINVTVMECPPGYIHQNNSGPKRCICYLNMENHSTGIERCSDSKFQAYVKHGYWIGYVSKNDMRLAIAICPRGFCNESKSSREHPLPPESDVKDLSPYICNSNRHGTLCGTCKENNSAHYHSTTFRCKPNKLCQWGWAFYILSELVPISVLFLVVIFFNISFTSGQLNGVVFFMQVVDTMKLNAENFIDFGEFKNVSIIHKLVYRTFSLKTFAIHQFSFCLWSGASALDMLAFRYVTILYSLFLVFATAFFLKICNFHRKCSKGKINLRRSIIHGLSAFLVMSYSECTRVSLLILTIGTLRTISDTPETIKVSFYNGDYLHMGPEHLKYAIPAIFFILTMVSIPPLLLLSYPLCYKLFALLRIEESRFVQITCKIFPLEKIKPLFDSMQGTFKDRYRFFSGLYFMYRLCLLLTFLYSSTLPMYYTITGIQLTCILALHAMCGPYKKTWHNILDALLFANLAIINALTFINYQLTSANNSYTTIQNIICLQTVLVLIPLVYLVIYAAYHIVKAAGVCKSTPRDHREELDNSNEVIKNLETRHLDNSTMEMSEYRLLSPDRN